MTNIQRMPVNSELEQIYSAYTKATSMVERAQHYLHEMIESELARARIEINSIQSLLIYNIGDQELTAGELYTRGGYLGTNVSYNLKKLVDRGFLDQQRSQLDRRVQRIRLTDKGREVRNTVETLHRKCSPLMDQYGLSADKLTAMNETLLLLEKFWAGSMHER